MPLVITVMRPKLEPGLLGDALGEHVPRGDAELAADDEGDADAVEEQPDEELHESTDEHGSGVGGIGEAWSNPIP